MKSKPRSQTAEFEKIIKEAGSDQYVLRLYVTGITAKSTQAIANIRALCEEHLSGRYDLEVVDIYQQPTEAVNSQIVAAPTLIKQSPMPVRKMIGDLTDRDRVMVGLDLKKSSGDKAKLAKEIKWVTL
ncbi:MAG TPA: circadian clock KaiB family protein [Tepidisphaeraceae bacterium]